MIPINFLINKFFPQNCTICTKRVLKGNEIICIECLGDLSKTNFHLLENNPVKNRFKGLVSCTSASSFLFFNKENSTHQLLHQIKYNGQQELAKELGRIYAEDLKNTNVKNCELIIPLPLHPSKQTLRGYNQSRLISDGVSEILSIPVEENALNRTINNISQTNLNREERAKNVSNIFSIKDASSIRNKKIILIDDVITTGATIEMAAKILIEAGVKELHILSLACAFEL